MLDEEDHMRHLLEPEVSSQLSHWLSSSAGGKGKMVTSGRRNCRGERKDFTRGT